MGLKDKINEEMVVDAESYLDRYFDQANELFRILEDGTVDITEEFKNASWREQVLIYLIGQRYAYEGDRTEKPSLPYDYFYARFDVDESTIRAYMNELKDESIVEKSEESNDWVIIPSNLSSAFLKIEGLEE